MGDVLEETISMNSVQCTLLFILQQIRMCGYRESDKLLTDICQFAHHAWLIIACHGLLVVTSVALFGCSCQKRHDIHVVGWLDKILCGQQELCDRCRGTVIRPVIYFSNSRRSYLSGYGTSMNHSEFLHIYILVCFIKINYIIH